MQARLARRDVDVDGKISRAEALKAGVASWAQDLHWRERELQQRNSAKDLRRPMGSAGDWKMFNQAIVDVQLRHAIAQYTAPQTRKAKVLGSTKFPQLLQERLTMRILDDGVEEQADDFVQQMARLKLNVDLMSGPVTPGLTALEHIRLQTCLLRERDHSVFRHLAKQALSCPAGHCDTHIDEKKLQRWWEMTKKAFNDRLAAIQKERLAMLGAALDLVASKGPAFLPHTHDYPSTTGIAILRETADGTPPVSETSSPPLDLPSEDDESNDRSPFGARGGLSVPDPDDV